VDEKVELPWIYRRWVRRVFLVCSVGCAIIVGSTIFEIIRNSIIPSAIEPVPEFSALHWAIWLVFFLAPYLFLWFGMLAYAISHSRRPKYQRVLMVITQLFFQVWASAVVYAVAYRSEAREVIARRSAVPRKIKGAGDE
jgi:hypothetical protein